MVCSTYALWDRLLEDISNTVSPDQFYKGLITLLDWLLLRLASDKLITTSILS